MNFATFAAILNSITAGMTINEKLRDFTRQKLNVQHIRIEQHISDRENARRKPFDPVSIRDMMGSRRDSWKTRLTEIQDIE